MQSLIMMKTYPEDVVELMTMFPDEEACLNYLEMIRWPHGYQCLRCSEKNALKLGRGLYRCQSCKYEGSVIVDTLFQDTHKPLRLWFQAIWYVVSQKNGVSALGLQKSLGLGSYHTAWEWLHKLRRAMVRPGRDKLNGIIEINETMIGGEKSGKRGRGVLENTIQQMVEPGSTIRTDGWSGYNGLSKLGYDHLPIANHNVKDADVIEQAHLVAALFKRWLIGTLHGSISHKNLPYYLDEFTFRFNRRTSNSRGKLFYRLIQQALEIKPVPAKLLAGVDS